MLEGVNVENETIAQLALDRVTYLTRENLMMEAALNDAHGELDRLRTLIPADEVVEGDPDGL